MNFLSELFFCFFLIVVILNYKIPSKYYLYFLFFVSILFYSYSGWINIILVLLIGIISYIGGLFLFYYKKNKYIYYIIVLFIVSPLVYFKYSSFILDLFSRMVSFQISFEELVVPLGMSFLTFQAISYVGDIYYGYIDSKSNVIKVLTYIIFFPNISSGPIQKARDFLPQLERKPVYNSEKIKHGIYLFVFGCFQKLCISDLLFKVINPMINNFSNYHGFHIVFFAICYSIYIYTNFNSYSDMAIGIAEVLGFDFGPNFKRPYLSKSIKEFWRRWHISLNDWFINYIYIPLGGGKKRKYINITIVFFISGVWHGAGMHFIIWGLLNAFYQIFGEITKNIRNDFLIFLKIEKDSSAHRFIQNIIVFCLISLSWIFFAIPSVSIGIKSICSIFILDISTLFDGVILELMGSNIQMLIFIFNIIVFFSVQILREKHNLTRFINKQSLYLRYAFYVFVVVVLFFYWSSGFMSGGNGGFLYFDF